MTMLAENAATSIQARFRGFRWRKKQLRGIRAVTKLQALQRGRFTRREFAELRDFSREQKSFQQATRRRQIRIWRNEQELYFLQHTNAADLERVRDFRKQHSARLIQRGWRATTQPKTRSKEEKEEIVTLSDRIYTFDPFNLATAGANARTVRFSQWSREKESAEPPQLSQSLFLNEEELRTSASARKIPTAISDEKAFAARRKTIQERIKRKAAQEKIKTGSTPNLKASKSSGTVESAKPVNRRRELYDQLIAMKHATAQRVHRYERETRSSRPDRELFSDQLGLSCENRLKHLQAESPEQMSPSKEGNQVDHDDAQLMEKWDAARRMKAWNHHRRAVCSVLDKRHWWQTELAGEERDIRRIVVAKSPWEDENKIWVWPRSNQKEHECGRNDTDPAHSTSSSSTWPSMEIQRFLVGEENMKEMQNQPIESVSDDEASEWWRAHCTQSHLAINGALTVEKPYSAEFSNNVTNEGDVFPVCTSEVVANRDLYKLQQQAKSAAKTKSIQQDLEQRIKTLTVQVERRVHEMETQVEANTQVAQEIVRRKQEQRARITREQQSAMTIQRYARGMQGRKHAREVRAEFFVMVRGRAIRRGRCEECGDQRAVLECKQCEESVHFCPICWVHVHSTRRRKTHVAIPMTAVVAPIPMQNAESTQPSIKADAATAKGGGKRDIGMDELRGPTSVVITAQRPAVKPLRLVADSIPVSDPKESSSDRSTSQNTNIYTATTAPVEKESAPIAKLSTNAASGKTSDTNGDTRAEIVEASSEKANGDTNDTRGSAITDDAAVAASSSSNHAFTSAERSEPQVTSEVTEGDSDAGIATPGAVNVYQDARPSGGLIEEPSQKDNC